ncbi:MAG: LLM class flavin-dependent oxidoreductase, partial [Actinobacteria bacterium]|nr:LLM class flavin-dependent oxidoreductase [Actinomycetota bacterium]
LGIGWMPEEFALTGADMASRGARVTEYVRTLRTLWAGTVPTPVGGVYYEVPAGAQLPRPVQPGGPSVLLGGMARPALQRVGRVADGWITSSRTDLSRIGALIAVVRESAEAAGRDPGSLRVICRGVVRVGEPVTGPEGQRVRLSGDYDQIRADTEWLGEQGVTEVFYDLNWDPQVGAPEAPVDAATERAREILHALAPGTSD